MILINGVFLISRESVAGLMKWPEGHDNLPSCWQSYISVDDVDATVEKAKELGGQTHLEPMDIPDVGRIAVISDPVQGVVGVMTCKCDKKKCCCKKAHKNNRECYKRMCGHKKCCKNCHFLAKYRRLEDGQEIKQTWNSKEKNKANLHLDWAAECYREVWSTGIEPSLRQQLSSLINQERRDFFFFPIHKGMSFPAAAKLEERNEKNRQLRRTNLYATFGLWLAGISSLCAALGMVLRFSHLDKFGALMTKLVDWCTPVLFNI